MFDLGSLKPNKKAKKNKKRVGRGISAGQGKTGGRGHKGQNSRSGGGSRPGFEGGQNPIYRRLPKEKGFKNYKFKVIYKLINLSQLAKFKNEVSPEILIKKDMIRENDLVKILGDGEINQALKITAHAFSKSAAEKIKNAGGEAIKCPIS